MAGDYADSHVSFASGLRVMKAAVQAMRPSQWTKNAVVAVPWFFAFWDRFQNGSFSVDSVRSVAVATIAFCFASSGIYILNDVLDVEQDRMHPEKKLRPVAAGTLPLLTARMFSLALMAMSLLIGYFLVNVGFTAMLLFYIVMQVFYSNGLKRISILDVMIISAGFVLRAVAGARAAAVTISPWLLLCAFLLALFLALCKRRNEKSCLADGGSAHRVALDRYDMMALDRFIAISACATIVCYAMYTLSPETVEKFRTNKLFVTVPIVVYGIFHYLDLLYREGKGARPEKILLTDVPMILTISLYVLTALAVFITRA